MSTMKSFVFRESSVTEITESLRRTADGLDKRKRELMELICEESICDEEDVVKLHQFFIGYHRSIGLSNLELPYNELSSDSGLYLGKILSLQNETLLGLNLSHNPLASEGLSKLVMYSISESVTAPNLFYVDLTDIQLGSKGGPAIGQLLRHFRNIQVLNLSFNSLGTKGIRNFSEELANHSTLRILNLSCNNIKAKGVTALVQAIEGPDSVSALRSLDLTANAIGYTGMKSLSVLLEGNQTIESLYIGSNNIGQEETKELASAEPEKQDRILKWAEDLATAIERNHTLKALHMEKNDIGPMAAAIFFDALNGTNPYSTQKLEMLNLASNNIGIQGANNLSEVLKSNGALKNIDISGNDIGSDGVILLTDALSYNVSLEYLNVADNKIEDRGAREIQRVLTDPKYHPLKTIRLEDNPTHISEEVLISLSRVEQTKRNREHWLDLLIRNVIRRKVHKIDWREKNVGNDELMLLNEALNDPAFQQEPPQIQTMWLDGSMMTSLSLVPCLGVCITSPSKVVRMYLNGCVNGGEDFATAVSKYLPSSSALEVLSLKGCRITEIDAASISEGLRGNTTLRRLNLDNNQIGDFGLREIASVLPHNTLTSLSANDNNITDLGMGSKGLSRVTELHLMNNHITDRGALELAKDLVDCNHWLNWVNLKNNRVTEKGERSIRLFMSEMFQRMAIVDY
mmetsp:Transcript_28243/g.76536  ORF Transcript_28243/g.76536 Transcript_28243/m.76536 type:complete len:687 (-) Transcript_28243:1144-3204(-)